MFLPCQVVLKKWNYFPLYVITTVDIKFIPHDAFHPLRSTSTDLKAK